MSGKKPPRPARINRLAKALAKRYERQRFVLCGGRKKPLARREPNPRLKPLIAYDLETTRIAEGNPEPLYITAYGENFQASLRVTSLDHLRDILKTRFLTEELHGARFCAWNGNNFDVYFIAAALLGDDSLILRPYLTRGKALRGLRVTEKVPRGKNKNGKTRKTPLSWEFLDAMAMVGAHAWPDKRLKFFLARFAPDYEKLAGPDWESEEFNALNPQHVEYAFRDSEGLYHALTNAQRIVMDNFSVPLYPTIGNTGIRIFMRNMPITTQVWEPPYSALTVIRDQVLRGGFCWYVKKYHGPVWKYDLNQAYAAAMRETFLPAGSCTWTDYKHPYARVAIYRITAQHKTNIIPFYYKTVAEKGREAEARFDTREIKDTWITSIELAQLERERWNIKIHESYFWDEAFTMTDYVNCLEKLRQSSPDGPNGAQGLMVKAIGNNSYGKTVESLDGIELVMSAAQPEGFAEYQAEDDAFQHIWFRFVKPVLREYHQPQIGAFITAHVRMVVRRAALLDPQSWLYADTDCVVFSRPVEIHCHPSQYGMWKEEVAGEDYRIINKKVYASNKTKVNERGIVVPSVAHCKGLNVNRISAEDFTRWFDGVSPRQAQLQRQNFVKVMTGAKMFVEREKYGEARNAA